MAADARAQWSLLRAAMWGCLPSGLLLVRVLTVGDDRSISYQPQTFAGEIAYWVGLLGAAPLLFVLVALIHNLFTPKPAVDGERPRSAFANFFWPNRTKAEPRGVARFGRVLHWLFAAGALAFVIGGMYAMFFYGDANSGMALIAFGGGFCFFTGRALRYVFAGE